MRAALIIVNYGSSGLLESNAAAIELPESCELIVVDCYSSAAERERVAALCERHGWTAVLLEENRGFGGGVNAGAQVALERGAEVLVTLNPDATLAPQAMAALIERARTEPDALVAPRIVTGSGAAWFQGADLYLDDGSVAGAHRRVAGRARREWLTGACLAVSAELWQRVGGFDEDYFLYWEDIDLSHRVLDAGGRLILGEMQAVHDEGQTHDDARTGRAKSATYYYYNVRNRLMYAAKHLDAQDRRAWLHATPRVSYGILLQGGRRQFLHSLAPWRAGLRGMRDGMRLVRAGGMPPREQRPSPRARGARA